MRMHDILKVDSYIRGVRVENTLMASLPPVNEIDHKLHEALIETMEKRIQAENQYLEVALPGLLMLSSSIGSRICTTRKIRI